MNNGDDSMAQRPRRSDRHVKRGKAQPSAYRGIVEPSPRMRIHDTRRRHALKMWLVGIATVVGVLVVATVVYGFFWYRSVDSNMRKATIDDTKLNDALDDVPDEPQEPFTILLTGNDARKGEEVARADTIILAKVDPGQKKMWMLSIPRDTRVEIPGHGVNKINAARFLGGEADGDALLIETVKEFTGIPVNYYMEVSFLGFVKAVDTLGGIWIDVDVQIDDWKAASHSKGHKASHIDPGYQLLDGEHALTFVRSRDFPDADFTRMKHQQEFFKALVKQMTKAGNLLKIPSVVNGISKNVVSTLPMGDVVTIARAFQGMNPDDLQTATITGEWRSPYVWPDEERKAMLIEAFISGGSFDGETAPDAGIDPSGVTVTVRNGAGIEGVATSAASILTAAGFNVTNVGNANQFVYDRTLVVYDEERALADTVLKALPKGEVVASRGMYEFTTDVLVVVGKDWSTTSTTP
ncbi:MAG TPA: LCP family protein [Coriobacteriia bacterium]|nr:LCP family protein [Coriobacteriia bacterium]